MEEKRPQCGATLDLGTQIRANPGLFAYGCGGVECVVEISTTSSDIFSICFLSESLRLSPRVSFLSRFFRSKLL